MPVAAAHLHVAIPEAGEPILRVLSETRDDLDAVDLTRKLGEHRCLIARTRADFQDAMRLARCCQFGAERNDVGLRNRLPAPDRQRMIAVGRRDLARRHEMMARHPTHSRHDCVGETRSARLGARAARHVRDLRHHARALGGVAVFLCRLAAGAEDRQCSRSQSCEKATPRGTHHASFRDVTRGSLCDSRNALPARSGLRGAHLAIAVRLDRVHANSGYRIT